MSASTCITAMRMHSRATKLHELLHDRSLRQLEAWSQARDTSGFWCRQGGPGGLQAPSCAEHQQCTCRAAHFSLWSPPHGLQPTCDAVLMGLDGQALVAGGQPPQLEQAAPGRRGQQLPVRGEGAVHQGAVVTALTAYGSHLQPPSGAAIGRGPPLAQRGILGCFQASP